MFIGTVFAILAILLIVACVAYKRWPSPEFILLFAMVLILGWRIFGPLIHD
jgi:uncharacterized membrane protein AbrB (regulator of aidB expression)